jgi:DNA-binding MarR family transcriptional regulator
VASLNAQECAVLRAVDEQGGRTVDEIAVEVELPRPEVRRTVNRFVDDGFMRYRIDRGTKVVDITAAGGGVLDQRCPPPPETSP